MNTEKIKLDELYPESDTATKRELEGLANSISQFRAAVHHIADSAQETTDWGFEPARQRRQRAQRRLMLEWAIAAVLCVTMLVPGIGYYRNRVAQARAAQEQALRQREADAALLDQVASEISETVPDAMSPLVEMDVAYTNAQGPKQQREENNGKSE